MGKRAEAEPGTQGSLFEEDFLRRTLGDVVRIPEVALGELVANAWDAGASAVAIEIPDASGETLSVEDDGCGLDEDSFKRRWMTLAYDRQKHQGSSAEFPPDRADWKRRAYGRNGQGRHAMLCFGDTYEVETWRDGTANVFEVRVTQGKEPFVESLVKTFDKPGHGTKISVAVVRNRPGADRIRDLISSRFLHDPRFSITVNGVSVPLDSHPGLIARRDLVVGEQVTLALFCVEGKSKRAKYQSGVAFWVGGRLVGEPGWNVGKERVLDGRTSPGRNLTIVVQTTDLYDEVLPDWTGFRHSDLMTSVYKVVLESVEGILREVLAGRVSETRNSVMSQNQAQIDRLGPSDRIEVAEMVEAVTNADPLADPKAISSAIEGMIEAKSRRSPQALYDRIMQMPPDDVEGMHKLLDEWTVRDALTVLDEVGRRIKVIEALEKVMGDPSVDELRVIHPLVTQARWLFGPEYESPTYASNVSIRNAVQKVFGQKVQAESFENAKKRPDLLFLPDSTLSAVATEDIDITSCLSTLRVVLLLELKKGAFTIRREDMDQAGGYIEDILGCGLIDGTPKVISFVVGHKTAPGLLDYREVGKNAQGIIQATTFGQLVRTANLRLFRVRDFVQERYPEEGTALVEWLRKSPGQLSLLGVLDGSAPAKAARRQVVVVHKEPFRRLEIGEVKPFENCVPVYELKIAAGRFGGPQRVEEAEQAGECSSPADFAWAALHGATRPARGLFVAQVVGESMNRRIPNGAWCVWKLDHGCDGQGTEIVLAQHQDIQDAETGGGYTVKLYKAERVEQEDGTMANTKIVLSPASTDKAFEPFEFEGLPDGELVIVAQMVEVLR